MSRYQKSTKVTDRFGKTRFACTALNCTKTFTDRGNLSRHQRSKHPEMGFIKTAGRPINPLKRENPLMHPKSKPSRSVSSPESPKTKLMELFNMGLITIDEFRDMLINTETETETKQYQWTPTLVLQLSPEGEDSAEQTECNRDELQKYLIDTKKIKSALSACAAGSVTDLFDTYYHKQIWIDENDCLHYYNGDEIDMIEIYPGGDLDHKNGIIEKLWTYAYAVIIKYLAAALEPGYDRTDDELNELFHGDKTLAVMECQKGLLDQLGDSDTKQKTSAKIVSHVLQKYQRSDVEFEKN